MSSQCILCQKWYHYQEDKPLCRSCYRKFKLLEIYDRPNEVFEWAEVDTLQEDVQRRFPAEDYAEEE